MAERKLKNMQNDTTFYSADSLDQLLGDPLIVQPGAIASSVNNGLLTIQDSDGGVRGQFTANSANDVTITVPVAHDIIAGTGIEVTEIKTHNPPQYVVGAKDVLAKNGISAGGAKDDVLVKLTNADYDTEWVPMPDFVLEAPKDGNGWIRKDASWERFTGRAAAGIIFDSRITVKDPQGVPFGFFTANQMYDSSIVLPHDSLLMNDVSQLYTDIGNLQAKDVLTDTQIASINTWKSFISNQVNHLESDLQFEINSNAGIDTRISGFITDLANEVSGRMNSESAINLRIDGLQNLGKYVGTFDNYGTGTGTTVPSNTSAFAPLVLSVNDFINVRSDETRGNVPTRYVATSINASSGFITWTYDISYGTNLTGLMNEVVPAVQGNFPTLMLSGQLADSVYGPNSFIKTIIGPVDGNLVQQTTSGTQVVDSGINANSVMLKINSPVQDNLAVQNSTGQLFDSGYKVTDFIPIISSPVVDNLTKQDTNGHVIDAGIDVPTITQAITDISTLSTSVNGYNSIISQLQYDVTSAVSVINSADARITAATNGINTEANIRSIKDDDLQSQINSIRNLGHFVGSFDNYQTPSSAGKTTVPTRTIDFTSSVTVNDFVTVREDETHQGMMTRYVINSISGNSITWIFDMEFDSGGSPSTASKADKVARAVAGNFAGLDSNGNLTDSGKSPFSFAQESDLLAHTTNTGIHLTTAEKAAIVSSPQIRTLQVYTNEADAVAASTSNSTEFCFYPA